MKVLDKCADCGQEVLYPEDTQERCVPCHEKYWSYWCEECGAEPEEKCADGCVNERKEIYI